MAAKKTQKPQNVTIYRPERWWRPAAIKNEAGTTSRTLEDLAVYDKDGIICWCNSCDLGDQVRDAAVVVSLPIVWKTFKMPDYTESRAHIVARDSYGER